MHPIIFCSSLLHLSLPPSPSLPLCHHAAPPTHSHQIPPHPKKTHTSSTKKIQSTAAVNGCIPPVLPSNTPHPPHCLHITNTKTPTNNSGRHRGGRGQPGDPGAERRRRRPLGARPRGALGRALGRGRLQGGVRARAPFRPPGAGHFQRRRSSR